MPTTESRPTGHNHRHSLLWAALCLGLVAGCSKDKTASKPDAAATRPADNIILIIADGMGPTHVEAGRIYHRGSDKLTFEGLSEHTTMTTSSLNADVTDSAASATAIATGQLVNNYTISLDSDRNELRSIFDEARDLGMATGLVTTSSLADATPAAFATHAAIRFETGSIVRQLIETGGPDVMLGNGLDFGEAVIPVAEENGFQIVYDAESLAALEHTTDKVTLGLFTGSVVALQTGDAGVPMASGDDMDAGTVSVSDAGVDEVVAQGLSDQAFLNGELVSYTASHMTPALARDGTQSDPTLTAMVEWALEELAREDGFMLLIETEHTDEISHAMGGGGQRHTDALMPYLMSSIAELDETVDAALAWINKQDDPGRTLIIVTADHETCGLTIDTSDTTKGTVVSAECTTGYNHTATAVDVFAQGAGVDLSEVENNTHIHSLMMRALGLQ